MNWNDRCLKSIREEKPAIEARYGIRVGMTDIYCSVCGKTWDITGKNGCKGSLAHPNTVRGFNMLLGPSERALGA